MAVDHDGVAPVMVPPPKTPPPSPPSPRASPVRAGPRPPPGPPPGMEVAQPIRSDHAPKVDGNCGVPAKAASNVVLKPQPCPASAENSAWRKRRADRQVPLPAERGRDPIGVPVKSPPGKPMGPPEQPGTAKKSRTVAVAPKPVPKPPSGPPPDDIRFFVPLPADQDIRNASSGPIIPGQPPEGNLLQTMPAPTRTQDQKDWSHSWDWFQIPAYEAVARDKMI